MWREPFNVNHCSWREFFFRVNAVSARGNPIAFCSPSDSVLQDRKGSYGLSSKVALGARRYTVNCQCRSDLVKFSDSGSVQHCLESFPIPGRISYGPRVGDENHDQGSRHFCASGLKRVPCVIRLGLFLVLSWSDFGLFTKNGSFSGNSIGW